MLLGTIRHAIAEGMHTAVLTKDGKVRTVFNLLTLIFLKLLLLTFPQLDCAVFTHKIASLEIKTK
jgi:hypothetical protein